MTLEQMIETWERRADGEAAWLAETAPYAQTDQKHLDANTPERAYWHYGYMTALRDVTRMARNDADLSDG